LIILATLRLDPLARIEAADLSFANTGGDICHGGNRA
jgi:antirestriction protein ArdC